MASTVDEPEIQKKITALQNSHHDDVFNLQAEIDLKRNAVYAERTAILKEKGPKNFWSLVIQSHPDISTELAGPYDAIIFESLTDFSVTYTKDGGYKLVMKFAPNDFFEDRELWAEVEESGGELRFSGVRWKEGKGPYVDDEEEEEAQKRAGSKRGRDERGPSLFEVFAEMPPHPEDDEELEEEDDEEMEELIEEWEEDLEDRKEVLQCLVEEVWANPAQVLARLAGQS